MLLEVLAGRFLVRSTRPATTISPPAARPPTHPTGPSTTTHPLPQNVIGKGGVPVRDRRLACKRAPNPHRLALPTWALAARLEMRKVLLELEQKQMGWGSSGGRAVH